MAASGYGLVDRIKEVADLVDMVSEVVKLRRSGRRYLGLCPFHAEKTPSFFVDPERQLFHCFGCGTGGDIIAFVMKSRGLSFPEALKYLAERYHIPVEDSSLESDKVSRQREWYKVLEEAENFYHQVLLYDRRGSIALEYLKKRGVSEDIIRQQKLGYAPNEWDGLLAHFRLKGLDIDEGLEVGLFVRSSKNTLYDRFRHRVIFPIRDTQGRVVAFGGRSLDESEPKYLNSPDTKIYNKGSLLYQYDFARKALESKRREERFLFLVEGYMDALAFHGINEYRVVATLGTAFTSRQSRLLKRIADEVVLLYDGDTAGRKAMTRIFPFLVEEHVKATCIILPEGLDPDDYLKNYGRESLEHLFDRRIDIGTYIINEYVHSWDGTTTDKIRVLAELHELIRDIEDPIIFREYTKKIAEGFGVSEGVIFSQFNKWRKVSSKNQRFHTDQHIQNSNKVLQMCSPEEELVRIIVKNPWLVEDVGEHIADVFYHAPAPLIEVINAIVEAYRQKGSDMEIREIYETLSNDAARSILSRCAVEEDSYRDENTMRTFCKDLVEACKKRGLDAKRASLKNRLISAKKNGDIETIKVLLKELQILESHAIPTRGGREYV